jgi:hypothetical protein
MHKLIFTLVIFAAAIAAHGQAAVVPVVELKLRGLMGGVQNGKWVAPAKVAAGMKPETEFVLVGWNGVEEGGVSLAKKREQEDVCENFTRMDFELQQDHGVALGSNAIWNPTPRMPRAIALDNATYRAAARKFLIGKGIPRPVVNITEAFRIDLEGDGPEEVVLSATYYKDGLSSSRAAVGDYSFVIVRKAVGKVVTDYMLEGEFIRRTVNFGSPTENHISAIADLNGDGKMEIVLYGFYYEGGFAGAYEMKNGRPVKIKEFEIGCGV